MTTELETKIDFDIDFPDEYNVIFHNDDVTPMDYVIILLTGIFNKDPMEAIDLMMEVHNTGAAVVARYSKEVADTKLAEVGKMNARFGYSLKVTTETA